MDHDEAMRQMMVERYLLGELAPDAQEAFEEHFFSCQECAFDVRSAAAFIDHTKAMLATPAHEPALAKSERREAGRWAWFRPAISVPVMALLVLILLYQGLIEVPKARREAAQGTTAQILPALSLINAATRGGNRAELTVQHGEPFLLFVDVPTQPQFVSYTAEMYDPAGQAVWSLPVTSEAAKDTVSIRIPGQQVPGMYSLQVRGVESSGKTTEVGRFPFELQFQN